MSTPVTTIGCAFVLASLVTLFIGSQPPEPVPLPRPRPPSPDTLTPSDRAIEFRWPKPVETVSFVQTSIIPSNPRATFQEAPRENRKAIATASPPRVVATFEESRRRVKRERREREYAYDICRGKGRIYTDSGRSWRCRR